MRHEQISAALEKWFGAGSTREQPLYLVGGTVRDLLLGQSPHDLDLVCRNAREIASDIARRNHASLVFMEKKPGEPCYRVIDRTCPDAFIDLAEMRGRDIHEDLYHRDFTINAMALEIRDGGAYGDLIDMLHGAEDIRMNVVRMVSDRALVSDPLRILRAVRHAATLHFSIEEATLSEMKNRAGLLRGVSAERVWAELLLILETDRSAYYFRKMDELGILEVLFPEIMPMKACTQNGYHHKDVWEHSLLVMENVEHILSDLAGFFGDVSSSVADYLAAGTSSLVKLASLLHDVGKPDTKGVRPDSRITFRRHHKVGADIAQAVCERLRMPNRSRDLVVRIVREHLRPLVLSSFRTESSALLRWFGKMRDDAVPVLVLGMADVMSSLGPESGAEYREQVITWIQESMLAYFGSIRQRIASPLLITGDDLIAMGMKPGIALGKLISRLRFAQDSGKINSREEALCAAREMIRDRPEGRQPPA
jgi:putative nucleotidyltransferase with HDIG domain